MIEAALSRHDRWRLSALLRQYPTLRIEPSRGDELVLAGKMPFHATGPDGITISDVYSVELSIPSTFPRSLALVRETEGRIPLRYHKLEGNYLCLGTPTEQRLVLATSPTLPFFVSRLLVPYLYGYSYFERYGSMPFGEEDHGDQGIRDHLGRLFHAPATEGVEEFLRLASLKKRSANKFLCPCGSGQRLGRCHNRCVNRLRRSLGTGWFRAEYLSVCAVLDKPRRPTRPRATKPPTLRETLERTSLGSPQSMDRLSQVTAELAQTISGSIGRPTGFPSV
jgi:hypothetical protein